MPQPIQLKDHERDARVVRNRAIVGALFVLLLTGALVVRMFYLQVVQHWIGVLAARAGLDWQWDEAVEKAAIRWASGRGNRNGRCAQQFARHWVGLALLEGEAR